MSAPRMCFVCDHDGPLREGQGGLLVCVDGPACADRNSEAADAGRDQTCDRSAVCVTYQHERSCRSQMTRAELEGQEGRGQAVVELCECEAARLVLRTDGTLYRFLPHRAEDDDQGRSRTADDAAERDVVRRRTRVCDLTRHDFGARVTVEAHGTGWLYAIHDDWNDGYPSRSLIVVTNEEGDVAEWHFTDSDPEGYPKTMDALVNVDAR